MILTIHAARSCGCGAGAMLALGQGGVARFVATRKPLVSVELPDKGDLDAALDRAEVPGAHAAPVTCWSCGMAAIATHVVIACDGHMIGADPIEGMKVYEDYERERRDVLRATLPPLASLEIPEGIGEEGAML